MVTKMNDITDFEKLTVRTKAGREVMYCDLTDLTDEEAEEMETVFKNAQDYIRRHAKGVTNGD